MTFFSIKELENFSGIKAHTIRTWEQRFSFLQPKRSSKLRRTYSTDELKLLLDISLLNRNGYKVSYIASMDELDIGFTLKSLTSPHHKKEKAQNELITCMAAMSAEGFERVLDNAVASCGIDETITDVIIPFLHKTGCLWPKANTKLYKANLILTDQSIRQKLITGIEKTPPAKSGKQALIFGWKGLCQPELLYMQYLLKKEGINTVFINDFISFRHLEQIIEAIKPGAVVTALGQKGITPDMATLLRYLGKHQPQTGFYNLGVATAVPKPLSSFHVFQSENAKELTDKIKVQLLSNKTPAF